MDAFIEVPAGSGDPDIGLLQLMLAEHGPSGVMLIIVGVLVWKVVIPGLLAVGKAARELFDQHLAQGADTIAELKALREGQAGLQRAVAASDEHNRRELESVRRSLETNLAATTDHVRRHDRELETIKATQGSHELRLQSLELHAGNSGVSRRPERPPAPPSAA